MIIREVSNVLESVSSEVSMRETSKTRENALKRVKENQVMFVKVFQEKYARKRRMTPLEVLQEK